MPAPELSDQYEPALLWRANGTDRYGMVKLDPPEEVRVRWVDVENQTTLPNGQTLTISGELITSTYVPLGSVLWQGSMLDWVAQYQPSGEDVGGVTRVEVRLLQAIGNVITPDVKNRYSQSTTKLARYNGKLPEQN